LATYAMWDPAMRLWDTASGKELNPSEGTSGFGIAGLISPDGRTIATGGGFGRAVRLWDVASTKVRLILPEQQGMSPLAFASEGQVRVTRSRNMLTQWDVSSGSQMATVQTGVAQFMFAAANPSGQTVFTFNQFGKVWDGATLQQRAQLEGAKNPAMNAAAV